MLKLHEIPHADEITPSMVKHLTTTLNITEEDVDEACRSAIYGRISSGKASEALQVIAKRFASTKPIVGALASALLGVYLVESNGG